MASTSKVIRISQDKYDKILSEGKMTETFDTVLGRIMERADLMGASDADTNTNKEE